MLRIMIPRYWAITVNWYADGVLKLSVVLFCGLMQLGDNIRKARQTVVYGPQAGNGPTDLFLRGLHPPLLTLWFVSEIAIP